MRLVRMARPDLVQKSQITVGNAAETGLTLTEERNV
jgi:hypothetical protein